VTAADPVTTTIIVGQQQQTDETVCDKEREIDTNLWAVEHRLSPARREGPRAGPAARCHTICTVVSNVSSQKYHLRRFDSEFPISVGHLNSFEIRIEIGPAIIQKSLSKQSQTLS
jgi:hypothetical protein